MRNLVPKLALIWLAGCPRPAPPDELPAPPPPARSKSARAPASGQEARQEAETQAEAEGLPGQGRPCAKDGACSAGLTCLTYYGVAGAVGPAFTSCEVRCGSGRSCPSGQRCVTIADGPGEVCRPE